MWREPGLRSLIYLELRRDELCDPMLARDCEPGHHGDDCEVTKLNELFATAREIGDLAQRAFELDFQCERHIAPPWCEIPADEYIALKLIAIERGRWQREQAKKDPPATR